MKTELTRESIVSAINDGAKSVSAVALAHGYTKPISGGTTKKIRTIVPEISDLFTIQAVAPEIVEAEVVTAEVVEAEVVTAEVVEAEVVESVVKKTVKADTGVTKRKKAYKGKIYGRIFAEAIVAGEVEFWPFVKETAAKLELAESQVSVALNVMRIPAHQSNGFRSGDVSKKRGFMHLAELNQEVAEILSGTYTAPVEGETVEAVHGHAG